MNCAWQFFLWSSIVQISKAKHGNVSDSFNFRGVTLSLIYGKMFDNNVRFRYGERSPFLELQFRCNATNLCSMVPYIEGIVGVLC